MIRRAAEKGIPIKGSIELLPLCNMNCDMCYVRLSREEMERQGRLRTAEEWLSLARQMKEAGTLFLLLTGGEPLIYPDFKRLYLELRNLGMLVTINTNATLIDEEWAAFFGEHRPRRINITLYGADERAYRELCHYPGGFDRVIRAVRLLRAQNVDVKVSASITPQNRGDVMRLFEIGDQLGVPVHIDTYMMPSERERTLPFNQQARLAPEEAARARMLAFQRAMGKEEFKAFAMNNLYTLQQIKPQEGPNRISCLAGRCSFTINWQGNMRPCVVLNAPEMDAFELGFAEAWKQMHQEMEQILLSSRCGACPMRTLCRTCAASAKLETGSYDGVPAYMCRYTQETYRLMILTLQRLQAEEKE